MLVLTLFPAYGIVRALFNNGRLDDFLLIFIFPFLFVVGSVFFHLEYLKQKNKREYSSKKRKIELIYWVFNTLSALTFVCFGAMAIYFLITEPPSDDKAWIIEVIVGVLLFIGTISIVDMFFVYKHLKNNKADVSAEIDKIGS